MPQNSERVIEEGAELRLHVCVRAPAGTPLATAIVSFWCALRVRAWKWTVKVAVSMDAVGIYLEGGW